jgi:hypothetical protein
MLPTLNSEGLDEAKWRKRVGLADGQRVFTCDEPGFYKDVRAALIELGWKEAAWGTTTHYQMMLTLKAHAIPHMSLRPGQTANHFMGSSSFCTKSGLLKCLEGANGIIPASPDLFSPRTFDLDDPHGYQSFVDEFRCVAAEAVVREAVHGVLTRALQGGVVDKASLGWRPSGSGVGVEEGELVQNFMVRSEGGGKAWVDLLTTPSILAFLASQGAPVFNLGVLRAGVKVTERRCKDWDCGGEEEEEEEAEEGMATASFPPTHLISDQEWRILRYCSLGEPGGPNEQASGRLAQESGDITRGRQERDKMDKKLATLVKQGEGSSAEALLSKSSLRRASSLPPLPGATTLSASASKSPLAPTTSMNIPGSGLIAAQLSSWKEKAVKEAPSPALAAAASSAFFPNVGNPPLLPTLTPSDTQGGGSPGREFHVAPIPPSLFTAAVQALSRVNTREDFQASLNASPTANVWIAKPSGKSRGRGIICEHILDRILRRRGNEGVGGGGVGLGQSAVGGGYIAQKYIERPLLIRDRKFDIRQWVVVTSWAPLEVWMYSQCYLRFCSWPFSLANASSNPFAHLSNNSVQKHSGAFEASGIEGNMWHGGELGRWLEEKRVAGAWDGLLFTPMDNAGFGVGFDTAAAAGSAVEGSSSSGGSSSSSSSVTGSDSGTPLPPAAPVPAQRLPVSQCSDVWGEVVLPQVRRIITWTLLTALDSMCDKPGAKECWEQYGFDIMLDASLKAWLIEVNSTPDMLYSTPVTQELVQSASLGMAALASNKLCGGGGGGGGGGVGSAKLRKEVCGWECIYVAPSASALAPSMTCASGGLALCGKALSVPKVGGGGAAAAAATLGATDTNSGLPPLPSLSSKQSQASAAMRRSSNLGKVGGSEGRLATLALPLQRSAGGGLSATRQLAADKKVVAAQPASLPLKLGLVDFQPPPIVQQASSGRGGSRERGR